MKNNIKRISNGEFCYNNYKLPLNEFKAEVFCFKKGIQFVKNLDLIRKNNIFDIGGYIGDSALILSQYTDKKVYSFEPLLDNFNLMKQTIILNGLSNKIIPENIALSSTTEKTQMSGNQNHKSKFYLLNTRINVVNNDDLLLDVNIDTLDNYCIMNNIDSIGLISVDIEGAEQQFLKGSVNTIKKFKPTLIISIYHSPDDFFNIKPLIENWQLGYKFMVRRLPSSIFDETVLICEM
jgi:FkbM family methyltransferase